MPASLSASTINVTVVIGSAQSNATEIKSSSGPYHHRAPSFAASPTQMRRTYCPAAQLDAAGALNRGQVVFAQAAHPQTPTAEPRAARHVHSNQLPRW